MIFDPTKGDIQLIQSDARRLPLEDESVQCIVTSPPYWGLRKYAGEQESAWGGDNGHMHAWGGQIPPRGKSNWNTFFKDDGESQMKSDESLHESLPTSHGSHCDCGAWRGAYGLEPTIEMYVAHTVEILRELRRVLRPDGVLFWNIGDSYATCRGNTYGKPGRDNLAAPVVIGHSKIVDGLKSKDLCLIPARVAIAAQQDGWWIRSMIIWAKPNPMPESCTDRPTDAYEHILMLTKSERYFWDADAVREPGAEPDRVRADVFGGNKGDVVNHSHGSLSMGHATRNLRNVWTFPTQPFSGAHFATFPEEIPRRCILAATSARGACTQCGASWDRVTDRHVEFESGSGRAGNPPAGKNGADYEQAQSGDYDIRMGPVIDSKTIGWRPTCECRGQHGKTRPCLVLDPFAGSGTTGRVARALRRHAVLADVAYGEQDEYRKLALARLRNVDVELPFLD